METFIETQCYSPLFDLIAGVCTTCFMLFLLLKIDWKRTKEIPVRNRTNGAAGSISAPTFRISMLVFGLLLCLLTIYFISEKLETRIDATGIHYRMRPLQIQERTISWNQMDNVQVRDYINYGRYGTTGYNTYDFSDNYGLYIFLKDGERILIGTKKPEEMSRIVLEYYKAHCKPKKNE